MNGRKRRKRVEEIKAFVVQVAQDILDAEAAKKQRFEQKQAEYRLLLERRAAERERARAARRDRYRLRSGGATARAKG